MTPSRETPDLATYGTPRSPDYVRVVSHTGAQGPMTRVIWRDPRTGQRRAHSVKGSDDAAVAKAKRLAEELTVKLRGGQDVGQSRRTVRDLWRLFEAAEFGNLRENTKENYTREFALFADVVQWSTRAERIGIPDLDRVKTFYRTRKPTPLAHSTTRHVIATAKHVWTWAHGRGHLRSNPLYAFTYKVPKDERAESPGEFSADEFVALLAALDPEHGGEWRSWVALMICGAQGVRQWAALHLQWRDVDLEAGVVTWRREWDKNGVEWTQPLRAPTRRALDVARAWQAGEKGHRRFVWETPWVLPSGHARSASETYTPGALWLALQKAETRAKIDHAKGRGAHGLRRLLAGEVHALTGDAYLALQAIGDRDPKMLQRYLKRRDTRVRAAFDQLDEQQTPNADGES